MSDGKRIFASAGISSSLDTILATTIGPNYHNIKLLKTSYSSEEKNNSSKFSEKSSSKSSSGSSLTLTNNNSKNATISNQNRSPHHQTYQPQLSQLSTSANSWNSNLNNIRTNSICSQKVRWMIVNKMIANEGGEVYTKKQVFCLLLLTYFFLIAQLKVLCKFKDDSDKKLVS